MIYIKNRLYGVAVLFCYGWTSLLWGTPLVISKAQDDFPPYHFKEGGQLTGILTDIVSKICIKLKCEPTYKELPWKRMLFVAKHGEVDATYGLFKTPEREEYLFYPQEGLALDEFAFFTKRSNAIHYTGDFNQLKNYKIGVINGYSYGKAFDSVNYFNKQLARNDRILMKQFSADRFDVGIGNIYAIKFYGKQLNILQQIKFLQPSVSNDWLYIAFSKVKGHKQLSLDFNEKLQEMKTSGEYQEILLKYHID